MAKSTPKPSTVTRKPTLNGQHRRTAALYPDGTAGVMSQPRPKLRRGQVLVEVHASLISAGTELSRARRQRADAAAGKPGTEKPRPFGYQNAGLVREVGPGVQGLSVGDRVACMGAGAGHTDLAVVPQNLVVPLPEAVSFEEGACGNVAATAMHALRRGKPELGGHVLIVGMGIVGQIAAQLARLAGAYVTAWDTLPSRLRVAKKLGAHAVVQVGQPDVDPAADAAAFTAGRGFDLAILAIGGESDRILGQVHDVMRLTPDGHREGRVVIVGGVKTTTQWAAALGNLDVLSAARTGPGYHDPAWELGQSAYPAAWVRWSTRDNLNLCFRLMAEGQLKIKPLLSHRFPLEQVGDAVDLLVEQPNRALGCVLLPR